MRYSTTITMRHSDNYNATLGARGAKFIASVVGGILPDGVGTVKRKERESNCWRSREATSIPRRGLTVQEGTGAETQRADYSDP